MEHMLMMVMVMVVVDDGDGDDGDGDDGGCDGDGDCGDDENDEFVTSEYPLPSLHHVEHLVDRSCWRLIVPEGILS